MNDTQLVTNALMNGVKLLPEHIRNALSLSSRPQSVAKGETDVLKTFAYGSNRKGFWSPRWCQYEIGIGHYAPAHKIVEGPNVGGVLFFIYPHHSECSKGKYNESVKQILLDVEKLDPNNWRFFSRRFQVLARRYLKKDGYNTFPLDQASKDFAWLITNTFDKFNILIG